MFVPSRRLRALFPIFVATASIAGLAVAAHGAGDDPVVKPTAEVKDVMLAVNAPDDSVAASLKKDLASGALDDESAEVVKARAAIMVEAGNLLLGLKPPMGAEDAAGLSKWKAHVAAYRAAAEEIRAAALKKDGAAAQAGLANLQKRCAECHKDHKKS